MRMCFAIAKNIEITISIAISMRKVSIILTMFIFYAFERVARFSFECDFDNGRYCSNFFTLNSVSDLLACDKCLKAL